MAHSMLCKSMQRGNRLFQCFKQQTVAMKIEPNFTVTQTPYTLNSRGFHQSVCLYSKTMFTKTHEWIKVDGNIGTIGITDYAQEKLGDIVFCELPEVDASFEKEDAFAVVESVKAASDLYIPVSGEVVERNDKLEDDPGIINRSPLDEGWLIKIRLDDSAESVLSGLLSDKEYESEVSISKDD